MCGFEQAVKLELLDKKPTRKVGSNHRKFFLVSLLGTTSLFVGCEALSQPRLIVRNKESVTSMMQLRKSDENIHLPVEVDGKYVQKVGIGEFLTYAAAIPILSVTVLPLTVAYQVGKYILKPILPKPKLPKIDSGYIVKDSEIIPRSKRTYDIVVLGATGFTGGLCVRHLAKTYGVGKNVKWSIAGRSKDKLEKLKRQLAVELNDESIMNVDTITADTTVTSSLPSLVRDTRAIISTAGPFTLYGSPVVEFCAKFGTHYADIAAEGDWFKTMMAQWQATAKTTGAKLISFCGHDSVPWEYSVLKLDETIRGHSPYDDEELETVKLMNESNGGPSGGTIATICLLMGGKGFSAPDSDPFFQKADGSVHPFRTNIDIPVAINKEVQPWNDETCYTAPFFMSLVNAQVTDWSRSLLGRPSISYREFSIHPDFKSAFANLCSTAAFVLLILNPVTEFLVKRFLTPKPGEGPSLEDMETKQFLSIYGIGTGSKGTQAESVMYVPKSAGYLATAQMLVEGGLTMALAESRLPEPHQCGGFSSPAAALGDVYLERLQEHAGISFASKISQS